MLDQLSDRLSDLDEDDINDLSPEMKEMLNMSWDERRDNINKVLISILKDDTAEKPDWIDYDRDYSGNELYIIPKDKKFNKIVDKITKFIYSPDYEEGQD